jgi:hypothetical protein
MGVHREVLCQSSAFFASRLAGGHGPPAPCVEIHDCDDAEIYVETVGLMYCDEAKHRLLKQSVPRVLRIMKVTRSSSETISIADSSQRLSSLLQS